MKDPNRDIQAGHQILAIFEQAKSQLDGILDQQPAVFAIVDKTGRMLRGNAKIAELLDLELTDCAGVTLAQLFTEADWLLFSKFLAKSTERSVSFELPVSRQSGSAEVVSIFWQLQMLRVESRSDLHLISVMGQDISILRKTERQLSEVFASTPVGLLTIESDGLVSPTYSTYCEKLFLTNEIAGQSVHDLVFAPGSSHYSADQAQAVEQLPQLFGGPKADFEDFKRRLPSQIIYSSRIDLRHQKIVGITYHPIGTGPKLTRILVVLEDRTVQFELQRLKEQASLLEEEATIRILQVKRCRPELLKALVDDFGEIFRKLPALVASKNWETVMHTLHSIKGNARIVDFEGIAEMAHDFESFLSTPKEKDEAWFQEVEDRVENLVAEWKEYSELVFALNKKAVVAAESVSRGKAGVLEDIVKRYRRIMNLGPERNKIAADRLELALKTLNSTPLAEMETKLKSHVERVSKEQGQTVEIVCDWKDVRVDQALWSALSECFVHLLNNSLVHGIKKSGEGKIGIDCRESHDYLTIEVWDDGEGINVERVNTQAVQNRLISLNESLNWSSQQLIQLIFKPEFSTATEVDQLAGRGVGLHVVSTRVQQLNGAITANTRQPHGTRFEMNFPLEPKSTDKEFIALSTFVAKLREELAGLNAEHGLRIQFTETNFDQKDFVLFVLPDALLLALSTILTSVATTNELRVSTQVQQARVVLDVEFVKTIPQVDLLPEFTVSLPTCYSICFAHQGEVAQRDRGMVISFSHIVGQEKLPTLKAIVENPAEPQFRETLSRLREAASHFGIQLLGLEASGSEINTIQIVEGPRDGKSLNEGLCIACGTSVPNLKDELVRIVGSLLR